MRKMLALMAFLLLFTTACAVSRFTPTGQAQAPYDGIVKVYYERPSNVTYEEVGIVSSQGGSAHTFADLVASMQKEAARYGANALVLGNQQDSPQAYLVGSQFGVFGGMSQQKNLSGLAIRIK